jgi:hypothetical protein
MAKSYKITLTATADFEDTSLKSLAKLSIALEEPAASLAKALGIKAESIEIDAKPIRGGKD